MSTFIQGFIGFSIGAVIGWLLSRAIIKIIKKYEKK